MFVQNASFYQERLGTNIGKRHSKKSGCVSLGEYHGVFPGPGNAIVLSNRSKYAGRLVFSGERKRRFCALLFICKNDHFTKTGSGQTLQGNLKKGAPFSYSVGGDDEGKGRDV